MATYAQILAQYQDNSILSSLVTGMLPDGVTPVATVQRQSAGFMSSGQSAKQYVGLVSLSASVTTTVTLETVTTGKTFYISDIFIASDAASGSSTTVDVRIQAAGTDIFRGGVHNLTPIDLTGIETQPFASSTQIVTILFPVVAAAPKIWYNVYGWEQ